jgi:hypothetical protein
MEAMANHAPSVPMPRRGSALEVLGVSTRLGLTSFGGLIAHHGSRSASWPGGARLHWSPRSNSGLGALLRAADRAADLSTMGAQ